MNDLAPLFKQFGVWLGVLLVVTYFLLRHWWPYWKAKDQRREARDQQREEEGRKVVDRMQTLAEVSIREMTESLRANSKESEKVSDHLEELTNEIRRSKQR